MVVVAHFSSRWPEPIYIWDLRRNHVQKIGNFSRLSLYYVSAIENVLVTFERVGLDQPPKMQQTKWKTTDGQLLEEKVFYLHLPADCPKRYFISPSFCRISSRKSVAYFMEYFDNLAMMCLEYDHAVDRLSVRCANDVELISREAWSGSWTRFRIWRETLSTATSTELGTLPSATLPRAR